jgi:hypothetical protein
LLMFMEPIAQWSCGEFQVAYLLQILISFDGGPDLQHHPRILHDDMTEKRGSVGRL